MAQEPYLTSQGLKALKQPKGIRLVYQPPDEQKYTLKYIYKDRFIAMQEGSERQDVEKKWDKWQKQWEAFRDPRTIDSDEMWQSNHVTPITTSVVQTALSEMIDQEIRPFYLPRGIEKQAKTTLMQHIWDYAWWTANSDLMMHDVYSDILVLGTAITQEYYRKEKRIVRDETVSKKQTVLKERTTYDYDDVYGEVVPLRDFFVDEKARSFDGAYAARDCIRRYVMDIDDFMLMYKDSDWDQFDNAKLVKPGGDLEYYEYYQPPHGIDLSREVEVLHYWAVKPYDRFCIVANDILIRDGNNPYNHKQLPFCRAVDIKKTQFFYGKGEPELLESIQDESNTLRRMIIDRNHLDIDKMFLVSNRIGLTDEDLIARPHGLIPTDDLNATKPIEYGDIPRSVEVSLQNLEDDAVIATGINPRAQSMPQASTATEAAMLKESTLKRIELKLWLLKKEFFPRMAELRTENILQFYPQPRLEKIVGEEESQEYQQQMEILQQQGLVETIDGEKYQKTYRQIQVKGSKIGRNAKGEINFQPQQGFSSFDLKPDDFLPLARGGYVIRFEAGSNIEISKPLMQSKDLELFDRFSQIALNVPNSYDIVKLGDMILRDYDKNPDDYKPATATGDNTAEQLQMLLQLAQMENQMMYSGKEVPATPYASPAHTRVHLTFMNAPKFKDLGKDDKIRKIFLNHVIGEMMAQEYREQQGAAPPDPSSMGGQQGPPGQLPQGAAPMNGAPGAMNGAAGVTNKPGPGGMSQPSSSMGDILPSLNTGGSSQLP